MNEARRTFGLCWSIILFGVMYAELSGPKHTDAILKLLDAVTEDGPAAAAGFLVGAMLMHYSQQSHEENRVIEIKLNLVTWGAVALLVGIILNSIQIAIVPVLMPVGLVTIMLLPVVGLSSGALSIAYIFLVILSSGIHPVFLMQPPVGGPYPALAWLAYGVAGILVYRYLYAHPNRVGMVFVLGTVIGLITFFAALPDYFNFFGGDPDSLSYYQANPATSSIPFLSSVAHSGGLLNVVGNTAVGTYLLTACIYLQRFVAFTPLINVGLLAFFIYPVYVVFAAIYLGGFPGIEAELSKALSGGTVAAQVSPLDWTTFSSWVNNSGSWADLAEHEKNFFGPYASNFSGYLAANGNSHNHPWAFAVSATLTLVVANLWAYLFHVDIIDRLLKQVRS